MCSNSAGVEIECRRADTLYESKAIHADIWQNIAKADFLVVDVTELNPNVMIELGVAATLRKPPHVILIKSAEDETRLPFNAFAQRYLSYTKSVIGDQQFMNSLHLSMIHAITPAPYKPEPLDSELSKSIHVLFEDGDRRDLILSPSITHRRIVGSDLEYGSLYVYRNSWLLLGNMDYSNFTLRVVFRFSDLLKNQDEGYLGISVRNHHYLANWGHMVFFQPNGKLLYTQPKDERGAYDDKEADPLSGYNYLSPEYAEMKIRFDDEYFDFSVEQGSATTSHKIPIKDMPYVYGAGKVRMITSMCRVLIKEIEINPL